MQKLWILAVFLFAVACSAQQAATPYSLGESGGGRIAADGRQAVLLELFTSEGCSSCPPAEKNLAYLQTEQPYKDAEIVTLAFHVDYWDGLGWRDPFASPLFTQRQRVYDRKFRTGNIYTPQMVVDGDIEFVGSKLDKAEKAIGRSVQNRKADLDLEIMGDKLLIKAVNIPESDIASVYVAFAEDGLSSDVRRGENAGRKLTHVAVVRMLVGAGRKEAGQTSFEMEVPITVEKDWDRSLLKAVVFIQENHTRNVLGVGSIRLGNEETASIR